MFDLSLARIFSIVQAVVFQSFLNSLYTLSKRQSSFGSTLKYRRYPGVSIKSVLYFVCFQCNFYAESLDGPDTGRNSSRRRLYRQLEVQQAAPPTIFISGAKSPLNKAFVLLVPFLDQTNTILIVLEHTLLKFNCVEVKFLRQISRTLLFWVNLCCTSLGLFANVASL